MKSFGKKILSLLTSLSLLFCLLPAGALAEESEVEVVVENAVTINEYHLMNKSAFVNYYKDQIWKDHPRAWGIVMNGIRIYANGDRHTYRDALPGTGYYNVYAHVENGAGNIQPEDISHIELYGTYAWGSDTVTLDFSELTYRTFPAESDTQAYAEIYFTEDAPEVPEALSYDVTFDLNYAPADDSPRTVTQTVAENAQAIMPDAPQREDYNFLGWFENSAEGSFNFNTPITADLTLTANWEKEEEKPPVVEPSEEMPAWFFIRTDGLVPMENGNTSYPSNQHLPGHRAEGALNGSVTQASAWTENYGPIVDDTLNGEKLSDAFAEVQAAIADQPDKAAIAAILNYDAATQGIIWYVVKHAGGNHVDQCPGYHVDGILYTKSEGGDPTQIRVLNYHSNIPGDKNPLLAYSVHGLGTTATVGSLIPSREGYTFTGWNTQADGGGDDYAAGKEITMSSDYSLYAQWEQKSYSVSYDWGTEHIPVGVTLPVEATVLHGESHTVDTAYTSATTVKANDGTYTFSGWSQTGTIENVTAPIALTGNWTYTAPVTPEIPGGISYHTVTVNYLEQDTNVVLAAAHKSPRAAYGSHYDVTEQAALAIDGYSISSVNGETSGTLRQNVTISVYYAATMDIPEENTPLAPTPDYDDSTETSSEMNIPVEEIPLAALPETDVPAEETTVTETIIADENVPLGNLPQTGTVAGPVEASLTLGLLALAASLAAAGLGITLSRKKEEEI